MWTAPNPAVGVDAGEIVTGWLIRLTVVFAVLGVLCFDGLSLAVANLSVTDQAAQSAREATRSYAAQGNAQTAYEKAVATARAADPTNSIPVQSFVVSPEGAVSLSVERTVTTLVLHYLPRSDGWLVASATGGNGA